MRPRERRIWNGWKGSDGGVSCDGLPAGGSGIVEEIAGELEDNEEGICRLMIEL